MLLVPGVPGCCLVSFHFLCYILCSHSGKEFANVEGKGEQNLFLTERVTSKKWKLRATREIQADSRAKEGRPRPTLFATKLFMGELRSQEQRTCTPLPHPPTSSSKFGRSWGKYYLTKMTQLASEWSDIFAKMQSGGSIH